MSRLAVQAVDLGVAARAPGEAERAHHRPATLTSVL